ncbi:MAG TPA: tetraacyldisaccharide 4'-kinase [Daejeonella sp.]|nr:tetraacyldisaccharide 4'-kinase [Daejeonella sp.]
MRFIRLLLFPFSLIYGLVVLLRNTAFNLGIFRSVKFSVPVISIGNLAVGGAGKSPMTEYLVALLKEDYKIATLSRGYGRKTSGFGLVNPSSTASEVGDEPLQFKQKFPDITVAVCEKRVEGIGRLQPDHELIVLDDAYQHRAVKPGLSLLLFDYNSLFNFQFLLPTGDLREPLNGRRRADIIVVTKCPENLDEDSRNRILQQVAPYPHQQVFFSYLAYGNLQALDHQYPERSLNSLLPDTEVILLTGIANAEPLLAEIRKYTSRIDHHHYPDHHQFSKKNIAKLVSAYQEAGVNKLIITTQKDAQRLKEPFIQELLSGLPVYYLPVKAEISPADVSRFNHLIKTYAKVYTTNRRLYKA